MNSQSGLFKWKVMFIGAALYNFYIKTENIKNSSDSHLQFLYGSVTLGHRQSQMLDMPSGNTCACRNMSWIHLIAVTINTAVNIILSYLYPTLDNFLLHTVRATVNDKFLYKYYYKIFHIPVRSFPQKNEARLHLNPLFALHLILIFTN